MLVRDSGKAIDNFLESGGFGGSSSSGAGRAIAAAAIGSSASGIGSLLTGELVFSVWVSLPKNVHAGSTNSWLAFIPKAGGFLDE